MPILVGMNMSFLTYCALNMMPDWGPILGLPLGRAHGVPPRPRGPRASWRSAPRRPTPACSPGSPGGSCYVIGDTYSEPTRPARPAASPTSPPSAASSPFDALLDIVRRRRPAHRAVARPDRRRRRVVAAARRGLGAPVGDDRRVRRRRPPRPHGRRAVHDAVDRRLPPGPAAHHDGAGRPAPDRRAGPAVRPQRPRAHRRGLPRRPRAVRSRDHRRRPDRDGQRPARRHRSPRRRRRSACDGSCVGGVDIVVDGVPTGALPGGVAPVAAPTPARVLVGSGSCRRRRRRRDLSIDGRDRPTGASTRRTGRRARQRTSRDAAPSAVDRPVSAGIERERREQRRPRPQDHDRLAVAVAEAQQPVVQVVLVGRRQTRCDGWRAAAPRTPCRPAAPRG